MTETEFRQRLAATNMRSDSQTAKACRLVLVDGQTAYQASQSIHISHAGVSRALALLRRAKPAEWCPKCGGSV